VRPARARAAVRTRLAIAAAVLAVLAAPAAAGAASDVVGVYAEEVMTVGPEQRDPELAAIAATGFGLVRAPLYWAEVERSPGQYDFTRTDAAMAALARHGLDWLPVLVSTPPFRATSRDVDPDGRSYYPPREAADLGAFAAVLVHRYGPEGGFWAARPELPRHPIRSWQVWNEPNIPFFWRSGIDPAAYAAMLKAAGKAIHAADPKAEVVAAGIPDTSVGMSLERFLDGLYAAGAAGAYDTLALHAYAPTPEAVVELARSTRDQMTRSGDRARLWVTEMGWSSAGLSSPITVDEARQSAFLAGAMIGLAAMREELDLRGLVLFKWRDTRPLAGDRDIWPHHTGLLRADFSLKPAHASVVTLIGGLARQLAQASARKATAGPSRTAAPCVSRRRLLVRVRLRRRERIRFAYVHVSGRQTVRVGGPRTRVPVDLRGLPRGTYGVGISIRTTRGRRVFTARRIRTCRARATWGDG
jgi:hypothetical protein